MAISYVHLEGKPCADLVWVVKGEALAIETLLERGHGMPRVFIGVRSLSSSFA